MLYLFPELFPFCTKHPDTCKNFCLSYDVPLVEKNCIIKLIGGLLTLTPLSRRQITTLLNHVRQFDSAGPVSLDELLIQAKFIFKTLENDCVDLKRERIAPYLCKLDASADSTRGAATPALQPVRAETGINCIAVDSSRNSAVTSALPMPKKLALEDDEDNLLEQSQMIILIGRNIFRYKNIKAITFSALEMEINEEYQEIAEYGLSRIDVLNSLKESSSFTFSDDDSVVFFNG